MSTHFAHESSYVDVNMAFFSYLKWFKYCSFGQNCVVGPKVNIGNGVKVQNNISIYEIEDNVFLGPSMVFTNPRAFIVRREEFKKTLLKKGCSIGATIVCGVTIGEYALVGSGAVVNKDVKPYALMVGVPARQIGWVSKAGNTLEFDGSRYKKSVGVEKGVSVRVNIWSALVMSVEDLKVFQDSHTLDFPNEEKFSITNKKSK